MMMKSSIINESDTKDEVLLASPLSAKQWCDVNESFVIGMADES